MIKLDIHAALDDFSLSFDTELPGNGVTALFGPSGSGKTSVLRCMAGLHRAESATIAINGETWQDDNQFVPTHDRAIGYVFQESSLFSHLSAEGNLDYAEKRSKANALIARDRIVELLGISDLLNRMPAQLSGGERQRVAIARTLLSSPKILLMDEPLASLDSARKKEIIPYLKELRGALDIPIIYVSHSADEVAQLADHIVVLDEGRIFASGSLIEMMSRADFPISAGDEAGAVLNVEIVAKEPEWKMERVMFSGGELWIRDGGLPIEAEHRIRILAKDVSLARARHKDTSIQNILPVRIDAIAEEPESGTALVQLDAGGHQLLARITQRSLSRLALEQGELVWAQIKSVALLQ